MNLCPESWPHLHHETLDPQNWQQTNQQTSSWCWNSLVMQAHSSSSCPGGWSQMIAEVNVLDLEVLGWCGYVWSASVRPISFTAKVSETPSESADGGGMNIRLTSTSSDGQSCGAVSVLISRSLKTWVTSVATRCVINPHIFVFFYWGQFMIHLSNIKTI